MVVNQKPACPPKQSRRRVARQELLELVVTDVDPFGAQRYLRHREAVPSLPDLEEKGEKTLPGVEGALCDLYYTLWDPEPGVKQEVAPDRRYWRELLDQTVESSAYQELHAATQLKELQSVLGTIAMGEAVLAMIPEKDQKQLQELAKQQQEASQLGQQAQSAQAQAQAAQQLASAAAEALADRQAAAQAAAGQPQPEQDQPTLGQPSAQAGGMTPEQAKALANELVKQAAEAKAKTEQLQKQAQEAGAKAEELAEALLGKPGSQQSAEKARELARLGLAAVKKAQEQVQEVSDTVQAWGLEPGELTLKDLEEVLWILKELKTDPKLKKIVDQLGRYWRFSGKPRVKAPQGGVRITTTETGRDLKRAVPSELVALVNPALRVKALQRWTHGELRLFGQETRQKLEKGPMIVAEDKSGSMGEGGKGDWANWLVYRVAQIAHHEKRTFGWILFDKIVQKSKVFQRGVISLRERVEIARTRAGGGTDFERPLRRAVEMIKNEGLKKADILLITDGMCAVSDSFLKELLVVKRALEVQIFTVLVNVGQTADATVREFSDKVIAISELTAAEAESKIIAHL